jgi:hypothetical protein
MWGFCCARFFVPGDPWGLGGGLLGKAVEVHEDNVVLCDEGSLASGELDRLEKMGMLGLRTGWRTDMVLGHQDCHLRTGLLGHRILEERIYKARRCQIKAPFSSQPTHHFSLSLSISVY